MALAELVKRLGGEKVVKLIPVFNLLLGVVIAVVYMDLELKFAVFEGVKIGLIAAGLYSSTKNVAQGVKEG